jgi:hypothetical protein
VLCMPLYAFAALRMFSNGGSVHVKSINLPAKRVVCCARPCMSLPCPADAATAAGSISEAQPCQQHRVNHVGVHGSACMCIKCIMLSAKCADNVPVCSLPCPADAATAAGSISKVILASSIVSIMWDWWERGEGHVYSGGGWGVGVAGCVCA